MRNRCALTLYLKPHEVLMTHRAAEHDVIEWTCLRCGRILGETRLWPSSLTPPRSWRTRLTHWLLAVTARATARQDGGA